MKKQSASTTMFSIMRLIVACLWLLVDGPFLWLLVDGPFAPFAQAADSSLTQQNADIEHLQRKLERLEAELEQLKQSLSPQGVHVDSEPAPESSPTSPSAAQPSDHSPTDLPRSQTPRPTLDDLVREFRGEFDYVHERIGVLNQYLDRRVGLSMYVTTEFEAFEHRKPEFAGAKMELFPSLKLTDRIRAFGEFEFNSIIDSGADNPVERGKVELDQAWIEYAITEWFKPRIGIVLVPFGRYNLEPFDPVQEFTTRPIFASRVIPVVWSEAAAGFTGRMNLGGGEGTGWFKDWAVEYQGYVMNGLDNNISDERGLRDARGAFHRDNNHNKAIVGRMLHKLGHGLEIGLSGYYGSYDSTGKKIRGIDVDAKFTYGPLEVLAEFANFDLDPGGISIAPPSENIAGTVPAWLRGGYVEGRYRFWFEWLNQTWLGKSFEDPTFTGLIRYEQAAIANADGTNLGNNRESRLSFGLNYRPVRTVAFKFEYQFNRTDHEALFNGNSNGVALSLTGAF